MPTERRPTSLFHTVQSIDYPSFSPSADGERILIIGEFIEDPRARIELVLNWPEALAESQGR